MNTFRAEYTPVLETVGCSRAESFEAVFRYLESLGRAEYLIVDTGCVRQDGWIDGRSTVLFDEFLRFHAGRLVSVDIDPERCAYARTRVSERTTVVNGDSVAFLSRFARDNLGQIDLLCLDSYDVDWNDPHPSALHHLTELTAAMPALRSGSLVVVDDHLDLENRPGKPKYIVPFMAAIHSRKLFEAYQIGLAMP